MGPLAHHGAQRRARGGGGGDVRVSRNAAARADDRPGVDALLPRLLLRPGGQHCASQGAGRPRGEGSKRLACLQESSSAACGSSAQRTEASPLTYSGACVPPPPSPGCRRGYGCGVPARQPAHRWSTAPATGGRRRSRLAAAPGSLAGSRWVGVLAGWLASETPLRRTRGVLVLWSSRWYTRARAPLTVTGRPRVIRVCSSTHIFTPSVHPPIPSLPPPPPPPPHPPSSTGGRDGCPSQGAAQPAA